MADGEGERRKDEDDPREPKPSVDLGPPACPEVRPGEPRGREGSPYRRRYRKGESFFKVNNPESYYKAKRVNAVRVAKEYLENNLSVQEIAQKLNLPYPVVRQQVADLGLRLQAQELRKRIQEEIIKTKVPILNDIVGLSLSSLKDFLQELYTDEARKARLTIKDAKNLSGIVRDMNEVLRLEQGQSTQNLEVVAKVEKEITVILKDLSLEDPFVEYPALPEDTDES